MIYLTGDTHGDMARFYDAAGNVAGEMAALTAEDILIVLGDFGFVFTDNAQTVRNLDLLQALPFQILFVDGNHENFPMIYSFPVETWCGGRVHRIRRNVRHLMRGEIFDLQGHTFFAMGGAASIDRNLRRPGLEWWPEEIPSPEEYENASENLARRGGDVEYILTHTAPSYIIQAMGYNAAPGISDLELCGFLEWVARDSDAKGFRQWYFGHWHVDLGDLLDVHRRTMIAERFHPLLFDVVPLQK